MELQLILIVAGVAVLLIAVSVLLVLNNKKPKIRIDQYQDLIQLFDNSQIQSVTYVRHKVVVEFHDVTLFDAERLKESGAKGITIVGDKIKFYVSDSPEVNTALYEELKAHLGNEVAA